MRLSKTTLKVKYPKSGDEDRAARDEAALQASGDGFMNIPDGIDEELPFA